MHERLHELVTTYEQARLNRRFEAVFVHDAVGTPPVPLPPVPVEPDMPVTPPVVVTPAVPAAFDAPAPPLFGAPGSVVLQAPIATSTAAEEKRLV